MAKDDHLPVTKSQQHAIDLLASGMPVEKVAMVMFDVRDPVTKKVDKEALDAAVAEVRKWNRSPKVRGMRKVVYLDQIEEMIPKAIAKLGGQLDEKNGWLVNKAINDMFRAVGIGVQEKEQKEDSHEVTIRLEGAPLMGVPGPTDVDDDDVVDEAR